MTVPFVCALKFRIQGRAYLDSDGYGLSVPASTWSTVWIA
jgi:hypothetical protein